MIPFKFEYYKPDTLQEAFELYSHIASQGKTPMYYGGGTEIITMSRANNIRMDAVIDLKGISECCGIEMVGGRLIIGSAVTLSRISESGLFPILGQTAARIADHTVQCRLTIGGNICGTIIYKETVLPLMVCESRVVIYGKSGKREVQINQVFDNKLRLQPGEILTGIVTDSCHCSLPYVHVKKTKSDKIAYPLLTVVAVKKGNNIKAAFSGLSDHPFRSREIEDCINDENLSDDDKINRIIGFQQISVLDDTEGSSGYRRFVLRNTLENTLRMLEKVK